MPKGGVIMLNMLGHNVGEIAGITIREFIGENYFDKEVNDFLHTYSQAIFNYYGHEINDSIRKHTNNDGYDAGYSDRALSLIKANLKKCHDDLFDIVHNYYEEIKQGLNPLLCIPHHEERIEPLKSRIAEYIYRNKDRTQHTYKIFSEGREHYFLFCPIINDYGVKDVNMQFNGKVIATIELGYPFSKEEEKKHLEEAADAIIKTQNDTNLKKHTNEYISAFCHIPGGKEVLKSKLQSMLNDIDAFNEEDRKNNSKSIEIIHNTITMYNKITTEDDLIALNKPKAVIDKEIVRSMH